MNELYQLPDGWKYVKLANIVGKEKAAIKRGPFGSALKKAFFVPDGYKVYEQKHAIRDDFTIGEYYIDEEKFQELKGFEVKGGDIIISCSGTIGKIAVAPLDIKKGIINQALLKITLNNEVVETDFFVKFWTDYVNKGMSENSTKGAAIKNLASVKILKDLDIPLPPLKEQKRILSKLDDTFSKLDRAIQLHQENIDEANAYMSSVLNEVFSELEEKYDKKPLKDIVDNLDGKRRPIKASDRESISGEYPYYGASGIIDYVNDYIFDGEYLLISEDGANLTVRKYPIAFIAQGKFWVNNHAHIVTAKLEVSTNRYMEYAFAYIDISSYITGSAQPKLSQGKMNIIEFVIPPLEEQRLTVAYLDEVSSKMDKIKSLQKEKLQELKALKASILDSAFRGEL